MASMAAGGVAELKDDGPVLSVISKRLRALRKKLNRISQMEESMSLGKPINKEQEEVLKSKPSLLAAIDELEKLRAPLSIALAEEISLVSQSQSTTVTQLETESNAQPNSQDDSAVEDLLNVLYFGSLFDVKSQGEFTATMLTRTHERGCCLTYDYVTDDATDPLGERDLDYISMLCSLLISRPTHSGLSHKNALQRCVDHAKLWLSNSSQLIEPNTNVTYANLREKVNKIMSSDYFTTMPEMKGPVEMAAAAGNYVPFPVAMPVVALSGPVQMEAPSAGQYHEEDVEVAEDIHQGSTDNDASPGEDAQKMQDRVGIENHVEFEADVLEVMKLQEADSNQREYEDKEHYGNSRRNYQNFRGVRGMGSRRGYSNGRGGRTSGRGAGSGYNNGRHQYYEQSGSYYPRTYYNGRGRGGRGGVQNMQ